MARERKSLRRGEEEGRARARELGREEGKKGSRVEKMIRPANKLLNEHEADKERKVELLRLQNDCKPLSQLSSEIN